jgi:predicted CoA-binding protein
VNSCTPWRSSSEIFANTSSLVFTWYTHHGIAATPINPSAPSIKAYPPWPALEIQTYDTLPNLSALPHPTETSVSIITPPNVTMKVLEEAKKLGIQGVWLQPGTFDDAVLAYAMKEFKAAVGGNGGMFIVLPGILHPRRAGLLRHGYKTNNKKKIKKN